jgi:hypothetical protein
MIIVICLNAAQADRFGRLIHYCTLSGIRNDFQTLLALLDCDCRNTVSMCPTTVFACQAVSQFYNANDWNTNGANYMNASETFSRWSEKDFCLEILDASSFLYNGYRVFPGGKVRPGRDADPSPPSSAEVKNTSTLPKGLCGLLNVENLLDALEWRSKKSYRENWRYWSKPRKRKQCIRIVKWYIDEYPTNKVTFVLKISFEVAS